MCRSNIQGGRRCPHASTPSAKQRANANRKKNRLARKNLAAYFTAQGMEKTASLVSKMNPSAIPSLLDEMSIDPKVLGVEPPAANNAPQKNRVDQEVISVLREEKGERELASPSSVVSSALEESAEKSTDELLNTQQMPESVPAKTKQEIAVGFAEFVKDSYANEDGVNVHNAIHRERLTELYRQINDLDDVPEDRKDQQKYWDNFAKNANDEALSMLGSSFVDTNAERRLKVADGLQSGKTVKVPKSFMTKKAVAEAINKESLSFDSEMDPMLYECLKNTANGDYKVKKLGGDMYLFESQVYRTHIVSAPNGLSDTTDMVISRGKYCTPINLSSGQEITSELGLSQLSAEQRRIAMQSPKFWGYISEFNSDYYSSDLKSTILFPKENDTKPVMTEKAVRDVRMAHNFMKGRTIFHKVTGETAKGNNFDVNDLRDFHAGLVKRDGHTDVKKSLKQIYSTTEPYGGNPDSYTPSFDDAEESKEFATMLEKEGKLSIKNRKAKRNINYYTDDGYEIFARIATSTANKDIEKTDEDLQSMNEAVVKFSKKHVKKPRTVYRGQKVPYGMDAKTYISSLSTGQTVSSSKLLSTSSREGTATNFNGGKIVFVYRTKQGAALTTMSDYEEESEVLLPIGADFTVVKAEMEGDRGVVYLADKELVS